VTRAVASNAESLELDAVTIDYRPGDRFILCSDGITKALSDEQIVRVLQMLEEIPSPELLVTAALAAKSPDNLTAVSVEVKG
jgi:serine/threonine protein phosphatase PrpC